MGFDPVPQQPDFPAQEQAVLARWRERDVFARSLAARADAPLFSFFEGPPTANGKPGVHHVPARTFKDLYPRYRTMKGYKVPRQAGWDCHGIPVEVQVEKELGFTRKQDIEDYGVAAFNARCRESVQRHVDDWVALTERIGYWVDFDGAYWTMSERYIESVWWSLKRLWDEGLVYEGFRVVPYCPRCGTALSDHEVAQGYAETVDPSVYVRLPVTEGPLAEQGASLLVWTTTPWTLVSNTAVAIGRDIRYVLAQAASDDYPVVLAADLAERVLGDDAAIHRDVPVEELLGLHYRGPFDYLSAPDGSDWQYVTEAGFVTTDDGTGIVHLAPAFGEDDMAVAQANGLPVVNPVDAEGAFDARVTDFAGQFVKAADPAIIEHLRGRGLLFAAGEYTHSYPFCWRCSTPLLYYAKPSWYIATAGVREQMMAENAKVDWHPEHIRDGRYGNWLANNVDWALSRERYWGTPLPLWRCEACHHVTAVGSRAELGALADRDLAELDPHRPFVDEVVFACPACGDGTARRVSEVIDAWYDSGAMPFAQFGYPHADGSAETFEAAFPADMIAEGLDQTRGWFYSLMAESTLLFGSNSYRTVLCLGIVVDAEGRKMSKSRGNILDPWELIDTRGADALRWLLSTGGSPWSEQRVGAEPLDEVVRRFFLTLWNTYYFFTTYARLEHWTPPESQAPLRGDRPVMDRWILAELADTVAVVDAGLERFDALAAGRRLSTFVDDLSNWYVRRNRRRFWATEESPDTDAAFSTLHECLVTLSALLAPFTPFLADTLFENLVRRVDRNAPDSVHLLDFPAPDRAAADDDLRAAMATGRAIVELGRRARNEAQIGIRQPLRSAVVVLPGEERAHWPLVAEIVAAELNVKRIDVGGTETVTRRLKPNFRALGPDFGPRTPAVAAAITAADADAVAAALAADGRASLTVDGEPATVTAAQVQIVEEARAGWEVASDGSRSVALDVQLDDALRLEGLAREVVRALNELRKRHGLDLDERVRVEIAAHGAAAQAIEAHGQDIAAEVLAVALGLGEADGGDPIDLGAAGTATVRLQRVSR